MDGDVRGVVELFSHAVRDSDEELLELFRRVGADVGEFIERKEAEEALGETRARQRAEQRELKRTLGELASEKERLQALSGFGSACWRARARTSTGLSSTSSALSLKPTWRCCTSGGGRS